MPKQNEPTTKFKVDISELKKGMQEAQRQIRLANSEFKAATAGMDKWSTSADGISAKLTQLHKVLDAENKKLSSLEQQYEAVADAQGKDSKGAEELMIKINNQKAAIKQCESQISKYESSLDGMKNASDDADKGADSLSKGLDDVEKEAKNVSNGAKGAANGIKDIGDAAEDADKDTGGFAKSLGGIVAKGAAVAATGVAALGAAFLASAEGTREFRTNMAKIDTAFTDNGFTAKDASKQYKDFYAILGDEGQATEAVNHLSKLCDSQEELADWTTIATGVYGTFGDSLPIEGLTEAANETAKVGQVTGPLADAINWSTTSTEEWNKALAGNDKALAAFQKSTKKGESAEDAFNAALGACSTEQERSALITNALSSIYSDAAGKYEETAGSIMDAQRAQAELNEAMAGVGAVAEPVMTAVKMLGADLINSLLPGIEQIGGGITDLMKGTEGAAESIGTGISNIITGIVQKIQEMLPTIAQVAVSLVTTLVQTIVEMLPSLIDTAGQIVLTLIDGITQALPSLLQSFTTGLLGIIDSLITLVPQLITAAVEFFMALVDALPVIIPQLITGITEMVPKLVDALNQALPVLLQGAITLFMAIVQALPEIITALTEALPGLIDTIVQFVTNSLPQIIDAGITLLMGLVDALPQIIDALVQALPTIIECIVTTLTQALPQIIQAGITLLMALLDALPTIVIELANALPTIVTTIVDTLIDNLDLIFDAALTIFMALVDAIPEIVVKLAQAIPKIVTAIIDALGKILPKLAELASTIWKKATAFLGKIIKIGADKASEFIAKIIDKIKALPGKIGEKLSAALTKVTEWAKNLVKKAKSAGADFLSGVIDKVKALPGKIYDKIKGAIDKVVTWGTNLAKKGKNAALDLVKNVTDNIKNLPDKLKTVGKDLVKGLWNGIKDMTKWVKDKIKGFSDDILDGIKGFFGIHSPSRVMRDQVGKYISLGIAEGIDKNKDSVTKATEKLGEKVLATLKKNMKKKAFEKQGASLVKSLTDGVNSKVSSFVTSLDTLTDKFQSAIDEVKSKRSDLKDALSGMGGDLYTKDDDGKIVLADLKAQTKEVVAYGKNLNKLKSKISTSLMDEILAMDADEGYEYTQALLALSSKELAAYNKAYTEKLKASEKISNAWYKKDIEKLQSQYTTKVTKIVKKLVTDVSGAGQQAVNGFMKAFKNNKAVTSSLNAFCDSVLKTIKKKFKIHSPSKVMETVVGNNLVYGLAKGVTKKTSVAVNAMKQLGDDVLKSAAGGLSNFNSQIKGGGIGAAQTTQVTNNYNFNQTNNSPKALSRWDIYRQSKNLLGGASRV